MAYIWSYLKRYPNWLWLDLLGAMLFVTVILGMPTALAGMIDNGVTKGDRTGVYLWTFIMFIFVVLGIIGRITITFKIKGTAIVVPLIYVIITLKSLFLRIYIKIVR